MGRRDRWASLLVLCLCWTLGVQAQDGPNRVVRLVEPCPPGGVVDISGRPLALCVNAASGAATLDDLLKTMRPGGAAINDATKANGTYPHLSVELMNQARGAKPLHEKLAFQVTELQNWRRVITSNGLKLD